MQIPERQLFIGGQWVLPASQQRLPIINPANGLNVGSIPAGNKIDVDKAVKSANLAMSKTWKFTSGKQRAGYLRAIAQKVKDKKEYLSQLETLDCGKPIDESRWDIDDVAGCFEYYADLAEKLDTQQNEQIDVGMDEFKSKVQYQPLGAVALISPWNYPMLMATWKVAPALAAGCTAVLKPSELASITCLEFGEIAMEVGLPEGVLNVVTGTGVDAGAPLSEHKDIAKIAFTGSVATGRKVSLVAAQRLKPCSLELGGKSALIVFDDVDIDKAVEWVMFGCFWTNGQICSATSRLIVHKNIAQQLYAKLIQRAESINVCDPTQKDCRLGPLVSEGQYKKVLNYIEMGVQEGAKLITGGKRPLGVNENGYFIQPTVFVDVYPGMKIWQEEIFGPVISCMTFESEQEAIEMANNSEYGLAGAVISNDAERCQRVADALEVGIVWVNCSQPCFCQAPWGGVKNSGYGRELGRWGLHNFLNVKQVTTYVSDAKWDWYPEKAANLISKMQEEE
eukprot:TRINITY_DN5298_c3_g1_i1.p1 TRINITY_DN5298_c3_g1~~TRINITY_DN5298_c3_g1_i1.p1  ORF type:complete len:508 (-),score=98.03 TRINITY_DN5298_c3_g1_i1:397-1920(-)